MLEKIRLLRGLISREVAHSAPLFTGNSSYDLPYSHFEIDGVHYCGIGFSNDPQPVSQHMRGFGA